ncbi:gastrula zinc finger protein XlCGF8.2DB-like [Synchiropus splendidus]|uniref:gastrula zinc finger protein XlCGF8.2DB-like n=1 Tax=Synchiropus splendidus TaxID=270530 RepID=UPI00237EC75D|nr:gastrula zinc finger protein XlCGF8.2DB-like [Synchiropus splendidus]
MPSIVFLRKFVNQKLNSAVEEILTVFEKTICEYQDEIDHQRRLLEAARKPSNNTLQIEQQEKITHLDREEQMEPQIKKEMCLDEVEIKQEMDCILVTTVGEESYEEDESTLHLSPDETENVEQNVDEFMTPSSHYTVHPEAPESNMDGPSMSSTILLHKASKSKDPLKCPFCGKMYPFVSQLKSHMRIHTGERPFKCSTCGKGFAFCSNLKNHLTTHTGEKPFTCVTCGHLFSCSRNLKEHMRTHTGERPYLCNICGKTFSHVSTMVKHKSLHLDNNPYSCETCGARFVSQRNLIEHERIHTGEKPYVCGICGKKFTQKSSWTRHKGTHLENCLPCPTCGKDFKSRKGLNNHMRIHKEELVIAVDSDKGESVATE